MYVHMSVGTLGGQRRQFPGTGITGGCELPEIGAGSHTRLLEKQQAFSIAKSSLQPLNLIS